MRRLAALLPLALAACQSAHPVTPARPIACIAVPAGDVRAALAEANRQIAALRALVTVAGLDRVRAETAASAVLARESSQRAAASVAALALDARPYAIDPATVEQQVQRDYAREAGLVRTQAQRAQEAYAAALSAQVARQSATLANALEHRVDDAYSARVQEDLERENDADVTRDTAVAHRQLQLRIRLQALARTATQRRALQTQLDRIARSLAAASAADRSRDRAAEAAYRRSLEAAASAEYAAAFTELRKNAAANLALRSSVTSAQQAAPSTLALDVDASGLRTAQSNLGATAQQSRSDLTASGRDIAQRLSSIGASDAADTAGLRAQLTAMLRARATLAAARTTCRLH